MPIDTPPKIKTPEKFVPPPLIAGDVASMTAFKEWLRQNLPEMPINMSSRFEVLLEAHQGILGPDKTELTDEEVLLFMGALQGTPPADSPELKPIAPKSLAGITTGRIRVRQSASPSIATPGTQVDQVVLNTGVSATLESVDFKESITPETLEALLVSLDTLVEETRNLRSAVGLSHVQAREQSPSFKAVRSEIIKLRNRLVKQKEGTIVDKNQMMEIKKSLLANLITYKAEIEALKKDPDVPQPLPDIPPVVETEDSKGEYKFRARRDADGNTLTEADGSIEEDKAAPLEALSPEYLARKESRSAWQEKRKEYDGLFEQRSHKWFGRFLGLNPKGFEKTKTELNQTKATYSSSLHAALVERAKKQESNGVEAQFKIDAFDAKRSKSETEQKLELIHTGYKPWFIQRFVIDDAKRRIEAQKSLLSEEKKAQVKEIGAYLKKHKWKLRIGSVVAAGTVATAGAVLAGTGLAVAASAGGVAALTRGKRIALGATVGAGAATFGGATMYNGFNDKIGIRSDRLLESEKNAKSASYTKLLSDMDSLTDEYFLKYKDLQNARTQRKVATAIAAISSGVLVGANATNILEAIEGQSNDVDLQLNAAPTQEVSVQSLEDWADKVIELRDEVLDRIDNAINILTDDLSSVDVQDGVSEQINSRDTSMVEQPSFTRGESEFVERQPSVGSLTDKNFNADGSFNTDFAVILPTPETEVLYDRDPTKLPSPSTEDTIPEIEATAIFDLPTHIYPVVEGDPGVSYELKELYPEIFGDYTKDQWEDFIDSVNNNPELLKASGIESGNLGLIYDGNTVRTDLLAEFAIAPEAKTYLVDASLAPETSMRPLARPDDIASSTLAPEESIRPQSRPEGLMSSELAPSESPRPVSRPELIDIVDPAILDSEAQAPVSFEESSSVTPESLYSQKFVNDSYQDVLGSFVEIPESLQVAQLTELSAWAREHNVVGKAELDTRLDVIIQRDLIAPLKLLEVYPEAIVAETITDIRSPDANGISWYDKVMNAPYANKETIQFGNNPASLAFSKFVDSCAQKITGAESMTVGKILEEAIERGFIQVADGELKVTL